MISKKILTKQDRANILRAINMAEFSFSQTVLVEKLYSALEAAEEELGQAKAFEEDFVELEYIHRNNSKNGSRIHWQKMYKREFTRSKLWFSRTVMWRNWLQETVDEHTTSFLKDKHEHKKPG